MRLASIGMSSQFRRTDNRISDGMTAAATANARRNDAATRTISKVTVGSGTGIRDRAVGWAGGGDRHNVKYIVGGEKGQRCCEQMT